MSKYGMTLPPPRGSNTRKLIRIGDSVGITLPRDILERSGLSVGSRLRVTFVPGAGGGWQIALRPFERLPKLTGMAARYWHLHPDKVEKVIRKALRRAFTKAPKR